jgi:Ca2+-binding RTX toxin-like protein
MATRRGTSGNDSLTGTSGSDQLYGFGGNDTLNGGAGIDTLNGATGNDTYIVTAGDVLVDSGGRDTVRASISWDLGAGFENLIVTGHADTSSQGNDLNNRMVGNDGDNYFNARGGNDTLIGGAGDDYFDMSPGQTSSPGNDSIDGGTGIDTVDFDGYALSAVSVDLSAGSVTGGGEGGSGSSALIGIERFVGGGFNDHIRGDVAAEYLDGRDGNDSIFGDAGADTMVGGAGNDTLDGYRHAFASTEPDVDSMDGGSGNDLYIVDNPSDILIDASGSDTVVAYNIDWTLADGFENLSLNNGALESLVHGFGNAAANVIDGRSGWHVGVDGGGGNDTLFGSPQDDTLAGGSGNDSIDAGWDYDVLRGGGGNDTLNGGADSHTDTLTGGSGRDRFLFVEDDSGNNDRIVDFTTQIDELAFDRTTSNFTAIGALGNFASGDARFYAAPGATHGHDTSDRLVYNTSTGQLYYDADGSGSGSATLVATLQGHPTLVASDVTVI